MAAGIYRLVRDLRPLHLDDLGLVAALEYLGDEAEKQMGLRVALRIIGEARRLDSYIETSLYRIAQEALTNTARHSGVSQNLIQISYEKEQVALVISDQGKGFSVDQEKGSGWGLLGMRERADAIGATLIIHGMPGEGTMLQLVLELDQSPKKGE